MPNTDSITRRSFLGAAATTAAAATAFTIAPAGIFVRPGRQPPSSKLNIAGIGFGGMGQGNLAALETENIVALCDVDEEYAGPVFQKYPSARKWRDYREMLEQQKDIDAVVIATPDHTHAVITLAALQAGKHVYCQKPLTHNIAEARAVAAAAKTSGLTTQMGIQGHSGDGARLICEWIADGAIGEVREVDAWCDDSYYPWGTKPWCAPGPERPTETPAVPPTLDWDLWIGPAPLRPYHRAYHPMSWRCWLDFGCGWTADRGAHTLDPVVWALDLGAPTAIEASALGQTDEVHCIAAVVRYSFPARGTRPPVQVTWYEGVRPPRPPELEPDRMMGDGGGALFKGSKGLLLCGTYGNSPRLIPESAMQAYKRPEPTLPRVPDSHEQDWVRACKAGKPANADFGYGALVTEICHLGNIAKRFPQRLLWDAAAQKFTNVPEANAFVGREYRAGWKL
jgi:predicted dehydrogenase